MRGQENIKYIEIKSCINNPAEYLWKALTDKYKIFRNISKPNIESKFIKWISSYTKILPTQYDFIGIAVMKQSVPILNVLLQFESGLDELYLLLNDDISQRLRQFNQTKSISFILNNFSGCLKRWLMIN